MVVYCLEKLYVYHLLLSLQQPNKNQGKVIKESDDKEIGELGEGNDAKEDGVIEDFKIETSCDTKSTNNSREPLFSFIVQPLLNRVFLNFFVGGKRKRSGFESDSGSDWEREGKEQSEISEAPQSPDNKPVGGGSSPSGDTEVTDENRAKEDDKDKGEENESKEGEKKENGGPVLPRELHRTASIFLRNLAPTITKLEVEAVNICLLIFLVIC